MILLLKKYQVNKFSKMFYIVLSDEMVQKPNYIIVLLVICIINHIVW